MSTSELDSRNIAISMRKSVENLVISSQDAIGQSISQAITFSGVITQHTTQIIQEARNVSRSPSPSLRNSDGTDILENENVNQGGEIAIAAGGAGDAVSLTSVGDIARGDNPKASTPNPSRAGEGRAKKKSWYTSLYPTYKSKSDDFKRLFKDLPDEERLIVDYSCALQKDILVHGRLYASQNYLCFYASIFGWETSLTLRWKDVTAITKEKTALVIPNAILVCTESEKSFLTSFSGRDKAYLMLFRIWQNALMDQPKTSHEIWQWVHSCYGEELGFNSDDEGYSRDLASEVPVNTDTNSELDLANSSMDGGDGESSRPVTRGRDSSPPLVTNGGGGGRCTRSEGEGEGEGDTLPTDMSDTSDSEDKHHEAEKCTSAHEGRCVLKQQFPFNIDTLFTMMFTSSKFSVELLAERRTRDYVQAQWQQAGGLKCRQVSYVLGLTTGPIGPKEVHVTETQVMNKCSKPGALYSIDATSENAGIPYADYFTVEVHYCLQRCQEHVTELSVYTHVNYKKSVWPMVKSFLEKNAISGMEEYARTLEAHILAEASVAAPQARGKRKHRRPIASSQEVSVATAGVAPTARGVRGVRGVAARGGAGGRAHWPAAAALVLLLLLNAALYYRLYHPPHHQHHRVPPHRRSEGSDPAEGTETNSEQLADWSALLADHTRRHRGELLAWRDALDHTVHHLHQTEQALRKLLETIEPSLTKAQDGDTDSEARERSEEDNAQAQPPTTGPHNEL